MQQHQADKNLFLPWCISRRYGCRWLCKHPSRGPMVEKTPYFLINDKKGGFIMDKTRLPSSLYNKALISTELFDVNGDGKFDVFVAGADPDGNVSNMSSTCLLNDGNNRFVSTKPIPVDLLMSSDSNGLVSLDLTYHLRNYYLLRTDYQVESISKL